MNAILHKNDSGNNVITHVTKGYDVKKVQEALGGVEVSTQDGSFEMDFISAYDIANNVAILNLEKARAVKIEQIRAARDILFLDFDKRYDIAVRDEVDLTELKAERQILKDIPEKAEVYLDSCVTIEEIKSLSIKGL